MNPFRRQSRDPLYTPGYLGYYLSQSVNPDTLVVKAVGAAAAGLAVIRSLAGIGAMDIAWAVAGLWILDLLFGLAAARKRKDTISGSRFFDGIMKGVTIYGVTMACHLLEYVARGVNGTQAATGVAAATVLGGAAVSLLLSISPNASVLWVDAGGIIGRVRDVLKFGKGDGK